MHFASYNYNYVKDQDYTEKTVDGKTVIRFVNVYQLDAASTYNFSFSVKIPENATANDYNVTVDAKVAKDNTTDNTETLLDAAGITVTAGKITVESKYIDYTGYSYDVAKNELTIQRAAPCQELRAKLEEANNAGNRVIKLVVSIDGTEFLIDARVTTGAGNFTVNGFAIADMLADVSYYLRVTANGGFLFETNAFELNLSEHISTLTDDTAAVKLNTFINAVKNIDESIAVSNYTAEEGLFDYSSASYDTAKSTLTVNYSAPSDEFKTILKEANEDGPRVLEMIVTVGSSNYTFSLESIKSGGGFLKVTGLALADLKEEIVVGVRITHGAEGENVINTNTLTVTLDTAISNATDSSYAEAYRTYYSAE